MSNALILGARNTGFTIIGRLLADGWTVTGAAQSSETLEKVRGAGADAVEVDITDQSSVLAALQGAAERHGPVDLVVNATSRYDFSAGEPFGGGPLAEARGDAFGRWASSTPRAAFGFFSAAARFTIDQGTPATLVQLTGVLAQRAKAGSGLVGAGAAGARAIAQAAALELAPHGIHVALLIVDGVIPHASYGDDPTVDPASIADAVAYLASQGQSAMTHELQITPALGTWTP